MLQESESSNDEREGAGEDEDENEEDAGDAAGDEEDELDETTLELLNGKVEMRRHKAQLEGLKKKDPDFSYQGPPREAQQAGGLCAAGALPRALGLPAQPPIAATLPPR